MDPIKVIIADDHRLIRDGLRSLLNGFDDIKVIGEADNGQELIQLVDAGSVPDVILMDIKMPEKNGIETTRHLAKHHPGIKIIGLTMFESEQYIAGMLQAGAVGYLLKNTGKQEVVEAIRTIASGKPYFSDQVTNVVLSKYMPGGQSENGSSLAMEANNVHLTKREKEILRYIVSEMTNQEIAEKLYISPRTVETHRRNLIQKLGVKNTIGLIKYALNRNVID